MPRTVAVCDVRDLPVRVRVIPRSLTFLFTAALCALLFTSTTAWSQGSTTATVRGSIQDSSGGIVPGATVTLTNTGTKAIQTTTSDDRGQYLFAGLFPG